MISGIRNSFQVHMLTSRHMVMMAGADGGTTIRHSSRQSVAPSSRPASMISLGNVRNWLRIQKIPKASDCAVCGRTSAQYVSVSPTVRRL